MKTSLLITFLVTFFFRSGDLVFSQIAVNVTGSPPDPAAMLDVSSSDKGFLLPRIDFNDRPDPAPAGLLIYVLTNGPYGNNAFYFFDGNRWTTFSPTIKFGIGDKIMGGTIIWLDSTNQHGLIVAPSDVVINPTLPAEYPWGCYGVMIDGLLNILGAGKANTDTILSNCQEEGIAAKLCHDLVINGFSDWFLPSRNELIEVSFNYTLLDGLEAGSFYWSSSSTIAENAYAVNINGSSSNELKPKINNYRVRCIRKF